MGCSCVNDRKKRKEKIKYKEDNSDEDLGLEEYINKNKQKKKRKKDKKNNSLESDDNNNESQINELLKELNIENENKNNKKKEINNKWTKEKTKEYLDSLYKSYYAAKTYFNSNQLKEKEVDAIQKCKKIISAQELLKQGNYKSIKIEELPEEINQEYIIGYSKEEKKKKINYILNIFEKQKKEAQKSLNEKCEDLKIKTKNINKNEIPKFKEESKKILDIEKNIIEETNKNIDIINKIKDEEYMPIPEYIKANEEYDIEKINKDIPENIMRINVSNLTYTKSNPLVILSLKFGDINMTKEIKGKNKDDINENFDLEINEDIYKNIIRNKIEIRLERTYKIKKNKLKGESEISLRNLMNQDSIESMCKIIMKSGKGDNFIDISIKLRKPLFEKLYEKSYREVLKIKKIYPKFNVDGNNNIFNDNNINNEDKKLNESVSKILEELNNIEDNKGNNNINDVVNNSINNNNFNKNINKNINVNNINNKNDKIIKKIEKNIFKEEELNDVDCIDNLNSLKVLEDRLKTIEAKIAKIQGRTPKELMMKKIKIKVKKQKFEDEMGEGQIQPKDYLSLMESQLEHDILLCKYLKQENEMEKAKTVYSRINLLNQEIKELKEYIN